MIGAKVGTNYTMGFATCARCRQWMMVCVTMEVEAVRCVHNHRHLVPIPSTVRVIDEDVAAVMAWGPSRHMGPIVVLKNPEDIDGIRIMP